VRHRQLLGLFGRLDITVPRGRGRDSDGGSTEWRSAALPRYTRMTRQTEALIAATYLAGTNARRVKRVLAALFKGVVGQGRGQPHLAQGQGGLGELEPPQPG
jgi:hypothetical protein